VKDVLFSTYLSLLLYPLDKLEDGVKGIERKES
jgi:hypothetical protein